MAELNDAQVDEIRRTLRHSKIEAVKIYKDLTGESLKSSKEFVESLLVEDVTVDPGTAGQVSTEQMDDVLGELRRGKKLAAIKKYRQYSGLPLKQSKQFIDKLALKLRPELANSQGCGAAALLFVGIICSVFITVVSLFANR